MNNPKVSVIMSVYNGMPYLKEAVKSILNQTYKNLEFIIVNDASADSSWEYLKSLKDKRIKLIKNKKNLGLAKSLNIALRQAQGDFIARMDADDISLPRRFQEQLKFLVKHPAIDICGSWVDLIDEKGRIIGEKKFPLKDEEIKRVLVRFNPMIHPTSMGKKSFFTQLQGYREEYDGAEDYDLLMRAMKKFKMSNIAKKLLFRRLQRNRRSAKSMAKMDKLELKIKLESIRENGFDLIALLWIIKKILSTYLIPTKLKVQLAQLLKLA